MKPSFIKTAFGLALLALAGCSSDTTSGGIIFPGESSSDDTVELDSISTISYPVELLYNYELLDYYYFYSHINEELSDSIGYYYNSTPQSDYGYSYCTSTYKDVCYMYSQMSDIYTRYYDPAVSNQVMSSLTETESLVGIGAEYEYVQTEEDSVIIFTQVYLNSPAQQAGLEINDTLLTIDDTEPGSIKAADALLSGSQGDTVSIKVNREGQELEFLVIIDEYNLPTVYTKLVDSIPVIQITEFIESSTSDSGTYGEFIAALKSTENYDATIIDLRDNPGGDADQCNDVSAALLSKGDTIIIDIETDIDSVLEDGEYNYIQAFDTIVYTASEDGIGKDRYYVFLADSGSASCAEVMLSAITVNKKSPVVGLTTYGKGIGQYIFLTYKQGIAIITGLQSTDKLGNVYHKVGIVPDYETGDSEEQMEKAVEWAKAKTQVREAGYGTESTGHFARKQLLTTNTKVPTTRKELLKQLGGKILRK